jgi:hypothetical protein
MLAAGDMAGITNCEELPSMDDEIRMKSLSQESGHGAREFPEKEDRRLAVRG